MTTVDIPIRKREGYLSNSNLLLIAFATTFFPRIIESVGVPSLINFVHFAVVPLACGVVLLKTRVRDRKQINSVQALLGSLVVFLGVMLASALENSAGLINVFVNFFLLAEAYVFLLAIVSVPFSLESLQRFRKWLLRFALIHVILAFCQEVLISAGALSVGTLTNEDGVQGVFFLSNGGHVVSAFVSMSFGLYYFASAKSVPIGIRSAVLFATFVQMLLADAKQVLLVFLAAWVLLILLRMKDVVKTLQYIILAAIAIFVLYWCIYNVPAFAAFRGWIRPEIYGPNGDATLLKTAPFRIIPNYYDSFLNWFLGLGPGHTIGRLGGWMIKDYASLLNPLGATSHPSGDAVWARWRGNYLDSSFFSPLWGFAGIWGDLGFLGLANYLWILVITWRRFCLDDFSRFIVLTIIVNGFIFTQLEEPGYMLSMTALIGLRWHELYLERRLQRYQQFLQIHPEFQLEGEWERSQGELDSA